jgi:plasmid stabilization system protein ParE
MDNKIILSKHAYQEIQESYQWYEDRSKGLGKQFIEYIDNAIKIVKQNPEAFPIKSDSYREIVFNKFPYLIVYEFVKEKDTIYILHIFHTKRNPERKYKHK